MHSPADPSRTKRSTRASIAATARAPRPSPARPWPIHLSDLQGLARLGFDATLGVTDVVEALHLTIARRAAPLGRAGTGRTQGVTGLVYRSVRGITRLWGRGVDAALGAAGALAPPAPDSPAREATLAAIQGLFGDHLAASGNPLAQPMTLRAGGRALPLDAAGLRAALPAATGRVAVLVHGLCMNDLQWARDGHHHGDMLARQAGYTPVAVRYNSGLHVSQNGRSLSALLEALIGHWPVTVSEVVIVGHSMGGLVARSACHAGHATHWRRKLTRLVCLGTPHHGARLERGGHGVDRALGLSPYTAPFARIGGARSAGITDLRHGNVQDADWQRPASGQRHRDTRVPTPLPAGVEVYCLAATTAAQPRGVRHRLIGDGLVTVASAWGEHRDTARRLALPDSHKALVTHASHWDLLNHRDAAAAVLRWLR